MKKIKLDEQHKHIWNKMVILMCASFFSGFSAIFLGYEIALGLFVVALIASFFGVADLQFKYSD